VNKNDNALPTRRQDAAMVRVEIALKSIEEAQLLLDRAAEALCSVRGVAPNWRKVGALHDRVKAAWHALDSKAARLRAAGRLVLDHEPDQGEERWSVLAGKEWFS
jgi:hypothetical protein